MGRFKARVRVDPDYPQASGTCDRCGTRGSLRDLIYQRQWQGRSLVNLKMRVCDRCLDVPAEFLKPVTSVVDPEPLMHVRPEIFNDGREDWRVTEASSDRLTEEGVLRILDESGPN